MHAKHTARRVRLRTGWTWSMAALVALLALSVALGSARPALAARTAVVGDCVPGTGWGTLNAAYAQEVLGLVNQHRAARNLSTLAVSPTLTDSAEWKSLHMAYYRYMDHNDPAPPVSRTTSQRLAACGYPIGSVGWGENIAYGYATPQSVMTAWLNSSGHRANIENPSYRAIGIGVARASNGTYYWTQNFGTLADSGPAPPPPTPPPATAPTVTLGSTPASSTTSTSASFGWTTTGSAASTTCSLDDAAATACSSPASYTSLGVGAHTFLVRVSNSAGSNTASYSWTVTATVVKPIVIFTQTPRNRQTPRFAWTTSGSPTSVTCTLDGAAVTPCSSPLTLTSLRRGVHTFVVTATNAAGSGSAKYTWYA